MRRYPGIVCWCLFLTFLFIYTIPAQAAGTVRLIIDEQIIDSDVDPIIHNDRTMVPLRIISEQLGAQVHWDGATRSVRVGLPAGHIRLSIGNSTAYIHEQEYRLDAAPMIVGDRTMVPLRFIGEALGAQVRWDASTRTVYVTGAKAEVRQITLQAELGREVVSIKGSGRIEGTVTRSANQVSITLPEAELIMPEGVYPLKGSLAQSVSVQPLVPGQAKGVQATITLIEPTPFTIRADRGELSIVFPYRLEQLDYEHKSGWETLTISTTGQVPYTVQQLAAPDRLVIHLPGIAVGPQVDRLNISSLLNKEVRVQDNPAGIDIVVDQNRVTKFHVDATATGLKIKFTPQIFGFNYETIPGGARVKISSSGDLRYHVTQLKNPDRLVVDFQNTILACDSPTIDVDDEVTTQIRASQFALDPDVTRLVVELKSYLTHKFSRGQQQGELVLELLTSPILGRYIGIDAGHGGSEPGSVSPSGLREKDINLDIAQRVASNLRAAGAKVFMVREGDVNIDFRDRPEIANRENVDILVSIHCNSFTDPSKRGTEVYYFRDGHGGQALASALHKALIGTLGLPDRGLRTANYNVIRYTRMPAALVEVAYMSNPVEEKLLADPAFRERAAQAITEGIMAYFRDH
ncbi:MAG: AMIN domain-containing protein [Firmicutes bacterium]|nr:AMIN domain-containing protein [Bacillota bacterium]